MRELHHLAWLTLATVEGAVIAPFFRSADGIASIPEIFGDSKIGGFFHYAGDYAIADFIADLGGKLEIIAVIVYAPGFGEIQ